MIGVVLWSDALEQKAVIWCEDHGELAYYRQTDLAEKFSLDAGDLVQFDVTLNSRHRLASNPRLLAEGVYPDLPNQLTEAEPASRPRHRPVGMGRRAGCEVVPLQAARS